MRSSHKLPLCEVSVFTTCAVRLNPPQCLFIMMRNLLEHPIPLSKNAELKRTPHCVYQKCGGCFKCPICFYKMWSPLELPTVLSENSLAWIRYHRPRISFFAMSSAHSDFRARLRLRDLERGRDLPNSCEDDSSIVLVRDSSGLSRW